MRVGSDQWASLGVFDEYECQWATVYVAVASDKPYDQGSFDLYACDANSPDDTTYDRCRVLGERLVLPGPRDTWTTYLFTPEVPPGGPDFLSPGGLQYVTIRVFSHNAGRYTAEVHCRPAYPTPEPTDTATPTPTETYTPTPTDTPTPTITPTPTATLCPGDADCDGVPDNVDNCPNVPNPDHSIPTPSPSSSVRPLPAMTRPCPTPTSSATPATRTSTTTTC